jgi:hypothetical protein
MENSYAEKPVALPPGFVRFETKPCATGSDTCRKTIGIVLVAFRNASRLVVDADMIAAGDSPMSSDAKLRARSALPPFQRISKRRFLLSTQPRSRSP